MRRALGLNDQPSTPGHAPPKASSGAGLAQPHRRRFVRDSDVAVTVVRRDHDEGAGRSKLDVARQALSEQTAARVLSICFKRPWRRSTISRPNWPMSGSPGMRRFSARTASSSLSDRLSRACGSNWLPSGMDGRRSSRSGMTPLQAVRRSRSGRGRFWRPRMPDPRWSPRRSRRSSPPVAAISRSKLVGVGDRRNPSSQRRDSWNGGGRAGGTAFGRNARQSSQVCEVPNQCNAVRKSCSITPGSAP
jgi:hypothetical protein